jgi:hypothetical protein
VKVPLKRLLDKRETGSLLQDFAALSPAPAILGIADASGEWWIAPALSPTDESLVKRACETQKTVADEHGTAMPLLVEDALYGVFYSSPRALLSLALPLHRLLVMFIREKLTQKALAQETLDRYREINLLYRVHETIGASLDLHQVIHQVLQESVRIIKADGGSVFLPDDLTDTLVVYDSLKLDVARAEQSSIAQALSSKVFQTGKPRILNDLEHDARPNHGEKVQLGALLCAPFKSKESVLGVITLARTRADMMFTAGDEKLLMALASQAGIAIANAQQVQEREQRLQQQIQALKIEIDQTKKHQEVARITESDFFRRLQENARQMRAEFNI